MAPSAFLRTSRHLNRSKAKPGSVFKLSGTLARNAVTPFLFSCNAKRALANFTWSELTEESILFADDVAPCHSNISNRASCIVTKSAPKASLNSCSRSASMLKLTQPHRAAEIAAVVWPSLARAWASRNEPCAVRGACPSKKAMTSPASASGLIVTSERLRK